MITDRKLLIILCITVIALAISKYITSEGYALKTNEIKFGWRNKTTDGVTKWVIKLTGGNSDGNLVVLETKEIKKEDEPEYFKPFKNNEIEFDGRNFDLSTVKQGLQVDVYYNDKSEPLITKQLYLQKNMFSITLDLLTKLTETLFSYNESDHGFQNGFYTIKSKTGTKKFIINDRDEFEFSDKTPTKECYDTFYLQKLQSWSNEFYLRSANNNKWTKTIRTLEGSKPYKYGSKKIEYANETKHYYQNRKFYGEVLKSNDSTESDKKDKFEAINTEDGSWRDNARVYKMDENYLYRIESGTPIKISDDEIVLTKVTNTCTVTQKGKGESTEFQKTVGWSNLMETSKWNEFTIPVEKKNYTQNKTCVSFRADQIDQVKTYANSVGTRIESDDTVETLCKRIFYTTPRFEEKKNGSGLEELPDWGTGCRHKGNYDRKGKTEGCEGKFSTADLYSSPPFRDLIKEYRTKESCGNTSCAWGIHRSDDRNTDGSRNPLFKYIKEYGTDVCPRDDKIKSLKDAIDAQCKKITEKGLCIAERKNDDTSSKITTIQNDFDTKKAAAKISTHYPTSVLFNYDTLSTDQKWIRDHLPDFSKNFDQSICNWRGSATEPVAVIDPRAGTKEKACEPKILEDLEKIIEEKSKYYANYVNKDKMGVRIDEVLNSEVGNIDNICKKASEDDCLTFKNTDYSDTRTYDNNFFVEHVFKKNNVYTSGDGGIHEFSVCNLVEYEFDADGKRFKV